MLKVLIFCLGLINWLINIWKGDEEIVLKAKKIAVIIILLVFILAGNVAAIELTMGQGLKKDYTLEEEKYIFNSGEKAIVVIWADKGEKFNSDLIEYFLYAIGDSGTEYLIDGNVGRVKPSWNSSAFPVVLESGNYKIKVTLDNGQTSSVKFKYE